MIHFNWGLHDVKMNEGTQEVPLEEYKANLRLLVERLKATSANLIWATTTPVPDADVSPSRRNEDVIAYNAAAKVIMEENNVAIDDLYSFALPRLAPIQKPADVHFTEAGYAVLAECVAAAIEAALKK